MKKIFCTLLMLAVMLTSTVAMAAFEETISEGADITSVKRLAVILPMYYKNEAEEPIIEEFTQIIYDAGKVSHCYVISYDEIAKEIRNSTGIEIYALQDADARRIYKEHIDKYADAYVLVSVANNIKKPQFFFEIYDAKSDELLYLLTTQASSFGKNIKGYNKACEDFYRKFDTAVEKTIKDAAKEAKKKK